MRDLVLRHFCQTFENDTAAQVMEFGLTKLFESDILSDCL